MRIDRRQTVLALTAVVLVAFNLRSAVTAVPPLADRLSGALGLSPTLLGILGALPTVAFAVAGLVAAALLRRAAAEHIAIGVVLLTAAGNAARPWLPDATAFLSLSALTLLAMGVGNVILPPLVKAWFPGRIGGVTAAYITVLTVGTALPALVAVPLADAVPTLGWRLGLLVWAVPPLLALPAAVALATRPRTGPPRRPGTRSGTGGAPPAPAPAVPAVHRSPKAWGLAVLFGMNALNIYAVITWLPLRLVDAGFDEAAAGTQMAVFTGIGVVPALVVPLLVVRTGNPRLLVVAASVAFVAGYLGLMLVPDRLTSLWSCLAGLGGAGFPLAITLIGLRSATPATAGAVSGFSQGLGYASAAAGPVLVGALHEATGGWTAPFGFLLATVAVMLVGGWVASRPGTVDDDVRPRRGPRVPAAPGGPVDDDRAAAVPVDTVTP